MKVPCRAAWLRKLGGRRGAFCMKVLNSYEIFMHKKLNSRNSFDILILNDEKLAVKWTKKLFIIGFNIHTGTLEIQERDKPWASYNKPFRKLHTAAKKIPRKGFEIISANEEEALPYLRGAIEKVLEERDELEEEYQLHFYAFSCLVNFRIENFSLNSWNWPACRVRFWIM